jgi:photosystem II stability/assembly factor-like uncharacterized protein
MIERRGIAVMSLLLLTCEGPSRPPHGVVTGRTNALSPASGVWHLVGPQPANGEFVDGGFVSGRATAVAVDPRNANVVYLGAAGGGVWKTLDGGATWAPLTDSQPTLTTSSIALDPAHPDTVYVGTGQETLGAGVLKSTDGGATWTNIPGPFVTTSGGRYPVTAIAVDPADGQVVLAASHACCSSTFDGAIWRSADGGASWTAVVSGGGDGTQVLFDPSNGQVAYAAVNGQGVLRSTDGGLTWAPRNGSGTTALPAGLSGAQLAIAPSQPALMYAAFSSASGPSFFKTTDAGQSWTALANAGVDLIGLVVSPADPKVVFGAFFGSPGPVLRSLDGGQTWSFPANGTIHIDGHAVAFSADGSRLYVGTDGGAWSTTDYRANGPAWINLNATLSTIQAYSGLAIHPTDVNTGFIGTQDNRQEKLTGSLLWQDVACGDGGSTVFDSLNPNIVYFNCVVGRLLKSTDGGQSAVPAGNGIDPSHGMSGALAIDPVNPSILYAATQTVYRTTDGASTWTAISPALSVPWRIVVAPSAPNTLYVASIDGHVHVTTNANAGAGATWADRSAGLGSIFPGGLAVDAHSATTAYLVSQTPSPGAMVFRTTDGGLTWSNITGNLTATEIYDIVADPDLPGTLYIGTSAGASFTSDGGTTWQPLGSGLPHAQVMGLALHEPSRTLRAATYGRSVWDLGLGADYTLAAAPASVTVLAGNAASSTVSVGVLAGFAGTVNLSANVLGGFPQGMTAALSPTALTGNASANLMVSTTAATPGGVYVIDVTGASGALSNHHATVAVIVTSASTTLTIPPSADAYVRDGTSAATNFGTATTLQVKSTTTVGTNRIAYLRFPLTGVAGAVSAAKLRLYGSRPSTQIQTDSAFAVPSNTWTETGITWNNRAALGAKQGQAVVTGSAAYYEWDVTPFVQAQRAANAGAASLAVQMDGTVNDGPDTFNAREAGSNPPQLLVTFRPDNPPTVATPAAASPSPVAGTSTSLSVFGADDGGETALAYTWSAQGTPPAAVSCSPSGTNAAKNSTATFTRAGSYTLQVAIADASGQTATSMVTVTVNQTFTTVAVSPATATVAPGGTQLFSATGRDQFGAALTTQPTFTWSASGGGTIDAGGLFTAGSSAGGPFVVKAASGAIAGTATVTVAAGTTTTVGASADLYVRDGTSAGTNFGTATTLVVKTTTSAGSNRITYLRFPLSGVSGTVTAGKLRLFGSRPAATTTTDSAFAVASNSWTETGTTWNNKPALGAKQGGAVTIGTQAQYYEWDVTSFVKAQKAAGATAVSLAVRMDSAVNDGPDTFNSRQAASNPPRLVVTAGP